MMSVQLQHRTFTVEEYYRMAEAGILREKERVELIAGEIVTMVPIGSPHASRVDKLTRLFVRKSGDLAIVRVQNPVHIDDYSEPQPDIALLQPREDFYAAHHPEPKDVLFIVEVADTSLDYDRDVKLPLYAKHGIQEVWIVNLKNNCVDVYTEPSKQGYDMHRTFRKGKTITSTTLPDLHIAVDEILG